VLEERRLRPLGADREVAVDVRFVAATNRDLARDVEAGRFRADLYYRLRVVEIRLPPLRERAADIEQLATHFLSRRGSGEQKLTPGALRRLVAYAWPGNVRELENELERASILAGDRDIGERQLSRHIRRPHATDVPATGTLADRLETAEREILREALQRSGGNRTRAAKELGLTRQGLVKKLARLGLGPTVGRSTPGEDGDATGRRSPR
jgi:transcriptional regulator with PAS, ATPase and Fis domain